MIWKGFNMFKRFELNEAIITTMVETFYSKIIPNLDSNTYLIKLKIMIPSKDDLVTDDHEVRKVKPKTIILRDLCNIKNKKDLHNNLNLFLNIIKHHNIKSYTFEFYYKPFKTTSI